MCMVPVGTCTPVLIVGFYGWASKVQGENKHNRTSWLIAAIAGELEKWPRLPVILAGDLNADPSKVPALKGMLERGWWHDLGARATAWGAPED
eukprot:3802077-Alexandrium_andersonii.AAC.1